MDIPQDIIDNVIAAIDDNKNLLKKCALVSSSPVASSYLSQKRPNLPGDLSTPRPKSSHSVLCQNHHSQWEHSESQFGFRLAVDE